MKFVVYLLMWLLLDPIRQVGGVKVAGLFLMGMVGLGVHLLVRRKDHSNSGLQDHYYRDPGDVAPVVYVVAPTQCPLHVDSGTATLHPARQPQRQQSGSLRWGPDQ
ncbi:hypothetical protein BTO20_37830 (plasmid) [Mycobacterium dioxanotrophicus]|jgi:hypothetical protein|uniref:Uncharacterized protein n=1 Tax=Mycobacterium dioxanotrophicus TaxID=482462 RepID=A0A1Y0CGX3_9MYCO|nr:hypothetical protein [Mycobacterium dioxanotrophicus]ART74382.1 hypothetical protein BTO20_37830 [Mycobacterium dioxanotrophicus]